MNLADLAAGYGIAFPPDLAQVWDLARRLRPLEPLHAFTDSLRLELVGPFDVLAGRFDRHQPRIPISQHWRHPLDPPELFTVFVGEDGLHWGYWFDAPGELAPCVVACYADQAFEPTRYGDDLLTALRLHLEDLASEGEDLDDLRLRCFGKARATGRIGRKTARDAGVVASTRDRLGVVAPVGTYREMVVPRGVLWQDEPPTRWIELARKACAEGQPATALQLGRDLWNVPGAAHFDAACDLLDRGYAALGREVLRRVLVEHRRVREREWLDILEQEAHETTA